MSSSSAEQEIFTQLADLFSGWILTIIFALMIVFAIYVVVKVILKLGAFQRLIAACKGVIAAHPKASIVIVILLVLLFIFEDNL